MPMIRDGASELDAMFTAITYLKYLIIHLLEFRYMNICILIGVMEALIRHAIISMIYEILVSTPTSARQMSTVHGIN